MWRYIGYFHLGYQLIYRPRGDISAHIGPKWYPVKFTLIVSFWIKYQYIDRYTSAWSSVSRHDFLRKRRIRDSQGRWSLTATGLWRVFVVPLRTISTSFSMREVLKDLEGSLSSKRSSRNGDVNLRRLRLPLCGRCPSYVEMMDEIPPRQSSSFGPFWEFQSGWGANFEREWQHLSPGKSPLLVRRAAFVGSPTSGEVAHRQASGTDARWLLARQ